MSLYDTSETATVNSNIDTKNEAMFPLFNECTELNIALCEIRRI